MMMLFLFSFCFFLFKGLKPKGAIVLADIAAVISQDKALEITMLSGKKRVFRLKADTAQIAHDWVGMLRAECKLLAKVDAASANANPNTDSDAEAEFIAGVGLGTERAGGGYESVFNLYLFIYADMRLNMLTCA